jgi:hypothetical protein
MYYCRLVYLLATVVLVEASIWNVTAYSFCRKNSRLTDTLDLLKHARMFQEKVSIMKIFCVL